MERVHYAMIRFGNIPDSEVVSGNYAVSHGPSPGTATIYTRPFSGPYTIQAPLQLVCDGQALTLPDCRLLDVSETYDESGQPTMTFHIADRLWRWQFGWIEGNYNADEGFKTITYWNLNEDGTASTSAARNTEMVIPRLSYREARQIEFLRHVEMAGKSRRRGKAEGK